LFVAIARISRHAGYAIATPARAPAPDFTIIIDACPSPARLSRCLMPARFRRHPLLLRHASAMPYAGAPMQRVSAPRTGAGAPRAMRENQQHGATRSDPHHY